MLEKFLFWIWSVWAVVRISDWIGLPNHSQWIENLNSMTFIDCMNLFAPSIFWFLEAYVLLKFITFILSLSLKVYFNNS